MEAALPEPWRGALCWRQEAPPMCRPTSRHGDRRLRGGLPVRMHGLPRACGCTRSAFMIARICLEQRRSGARETLDLAMAAGAMPSSPVAGCKNSSWTRSPQACTAVAALLCGERSRKRAAFSSVCARISSPAKSSPKRVLERRSSGARSVPDARSAKRVLERRTKPEYWEDAEYKPITIHIEAPSPLLAAKAGHQPINGTHAHAQHAGWRMHARCKSHHGASPRESRCCG